MIDLEFSDTTPGAAFICGSSDDGGLNNHVGIPLEANSEHIFFIDKTTSNVRMDLWYESENQVTFQVERASTVYDIPPLIGSSDAKDLITSGIAAYHRGAEVDFFGADNGKNELLIDFSGANEEIKIVVTTSSTVSGKVDAVVNPSNIFFAQPNQVRNFVVDGSIWDLASSKNNLCPNSYIIRDDWQSASGGTFNYPGHENGVGSMWTGSGIGPTVDGRIGIDIAVPGNINVGAYGPDSYFAFLSGNVVESGPFPYGVIAAVSGANPVLAGVVALMLEANPQLTAPEIKRILQKTARADSFTGEVPNPTWGYGKLDVYAALSEVYNPTSVKESRWASDVFELGPNPFSQETVVTLAEDIGESLKVELYSASGELVKKMKWNVNVNNTLTLKMQSYPSVKTTEF